MASVEGEVERAPRWVAVAMALLGLGVVIATTLRDAGTYAHTFADERTYSYYARVLPLSEAAVPSHLYLAVFSSTAACGDGALSCARLLNALLFAAALPFVYLVGRRFASWQTTALVVVITAVSPFNTYTAYFMPESMYFLGVWVLLWLLTEPEHRWQPLTAGLAVGLLTLIKLHGFFLAPSAALLVGYAGWKRDRALGALVTMVAFSVTVMVVRFGGGWLLAGKSGLSVLGSLYGAQAAVETPLGAMVRPSLELGWRHVQALVLLFSLPVAALVLSLRTNTEREGAHPGWVLLLFLVPLLIVTSVFSAKVAGAGPYESPDRLHLRYYNFLLPLLLLVAAARLDGEVRRPEFKGARVLTALAVIGLGVFALATGFLAMKAVPADCPELMLLRAAPRNFIGTSVLGFGSLLLWAFRPRLGKWVYLLIALPLMTLAATGAATRTVTATRTPTAFDTGAEVARRLLGPEGVEHLHVVTTDPAGGFRVLFTLNNRAGSFDSPPVGSVLQRASPEKDWLLYFGDYVIEAPHRVVVATGDFTLVHFE